MTRPIIYDFDTGARYACDSDGGLTRLRGSSHTSSQPVHHDTREGARPQPGNPKARNHDVWVNRYKNPNGTIVFQPICVCNWCGITYGSNEQAIQEGDEHILDVTPVLPEHLIHVNMSLDWIGSQERMT